MSNSLIELNNPSIQQPLLYQGSNRSQEFNSQHLNNYNVPKKTNLLKYVSKLSHDQIQKFCMLSSEKILLICKTDATDNENYLKIIKSNKDLCSNILKLPSELNPISSINFLKTKLLDKSKKRMVFIAGESFLCIIEIEKIKIEENNEHSLKLINLLKNNEKKITALASCPFEKESYAVLSGDEEGIVRLWKFSKDNSLLGENSVFLNMSPEVNQEINNDFFDMISVKSITSIVFNKKNDVLAVGNSVSNCRICRFPTGEDINSFKFEESQENVFLQFGKHNSLMVAYEGGSIFEHDSQNYTKQISVLKKDSIIQNKSKYNRNNDMKINDIFFSYGKHFLIICLTEKVAQTTFQYILFYSLAQKKIEETLTIKCEEQVSFSIINSFFAFATASEIQIHKIKDDFEVSIEPPNMLHLKRSIMLDDNIFWIGGCEKLIYYTQYSNVKNRAIFYPIVVEKDIKNKNSLTCLAYCMERNLLAASYGNEIKVWIIAFNIKKKVRYELVASSTFTAIKIKNMIFDDKGEYLIYAEKDKISYCEITSLSNIRNIEYDGPNQTGINTILYLNSKKLIIFSGIRDDQKIITLWYHLDLQNKYRYLKAHNAVIKSLALMPEKDRLISGGYDGRILVWDLNSFKDEKNIDFFEKEIKIPNMKIHSIAVSHDKKRIATGCTDIKHNSTVIIWNLDTGQQEKSFKLKETAKNLVFSNKDKHLLITQKNSIYLRKIKDYFYKSSFSIFHDALQEKLDIEEYKEKYPSIFNETFLRDLFLHFENKNLNQTILHIYGYMSKIKKQENYYEQCLKICDYFKIIPKFSIDINNNSPLDLVSKEKLYHSLQIILKYKFRLNFCPSITMNVIKKISKFDPNLLIDILENRFCEPYGVLNEKLPAFEGPIQTTLDQVVLSNEYIIKNIIKQNENDENKAFKKNFEIKILDIPYILDPDNGFTKSKKKLIGSNHPLYGIKEFEGILEFKWKTYVSKRFFMKMVIFLFYVILLSINSLFILPKRLYPGEDYENRELEGLSEKYHVLSIVFDIFLIFFMFYFLFSEFIEMCKRKKEYWTDLWNYFDLFNMGFLTVSLILDFINIFGSYFDLHLLKAFYAITLFLAWIRLVTYSRGFQGLGFMVRLLIQVFIDMRNFLFLMFFITLSITVAGFLLQDYDKFSLFDTFNSFYRLILGDFSGFDDLSDNGIGWILWIFFFIATLSLMIIMLNLIIAIISDTYGDVTENNILANNYEKSLIISEIDEVLSMKEKENLRNKSLRKYLCVLFSKEISSREINDDQEKKELQMKIQKIDEKLQKIENLLLKRESSN